MLKNDNSHYRNKSGHLRPGVYMDEILSTYSSEERSKNSAENYKIINKLNDEKVGITLNERRKKLNKFLDSKNKLENAPKFAKEVCSWVDEDNKDPEAKWINPAFDKAIKTEDKEKKYLYEKYSQIRNIYDLSLKAIKKVDLNAFDKCLDYIKSSCEGLSSIVEKLESPKPSLI